MSALRRTVERRRGGPEDGMTVPELAVVTAILSVVVLVMFGFLDQMIGLSARTDRQAAAESEAQLALRTATQNIRSALPVSACTSDGITPALPTSLADCVKVRVSRNTTGLGGCPFTDYVYALVDYSGNKKLVENRQQVSCTGVVSGTLLRRVLTEKVANTGASEPLFTFYRANGTVIPATDPAVPSASSLKLFLKIRYASNAPALTFSSIAAPRNNR